MKKKVIIFCTVLTTLSLTAFGMINWNITEADLAEVSSNERTVTENQIERKVNDNISADFQYDIGTRFNSITKDELGNARSFSDFIADEHSERIVSFKSLSVTILKDSELTDVEETTNSGIFSIEQINILRSVNYSTNILIKAEYTEKSYLTGDLEDSTWTPHLTIVPDKQAVYEYGNDALLYYLKENSKAKTYIVQKDKLKPAKLYFTITKNGTVSNAKIVRTSGYPTIDKMMIELINKTSGIWQVAENSKGEKVDQELVFSFGSMGC